MGTTPDRRPGPLVEDEEIQLGPNSTAPTQVGAFNYNGTSFQLRDAVGIFDPRSGGSGITEAQHQDLDTLNHWVDQTSYDEIGRTDAKVTSITVWNNSSKTLKIREELITRLSGKVSEIVTKQYDRNTGVLKETLTEVFSRACGKVTNITRTRVP